MTHGIIEDDSSSDLPDSDKGMTEAEGYDQFLTLTWMLERTGGSSTLVFGTQGRKIHVAKDFKRCYQIRIQSQGSHNRLETWSDFGRRVSIRETFHTNAYSMETVA